MPAPIVTAPISDKARAKISWIMVQEYARRQGKKFFGSKVSTELGYDDSGHSHSSVVIHVMLNRYVKISRQVFVHQGKIDQRTFMTTDMVVTIIEPSEFIAELGAINKDLDTMAVTIWQYLNGTTDHTPHIP